MPLAYIGLGSNVDPDRNLTEAAKRLHALFPSIAFSRVYRTAPRDVESQPDFLNAVARAETRLTPREVKQALEEIERTLKKAPPVPRGPRTIDLDLLLYDDVVIPNGEEWFAHQNREMSTHELVLPHPRMHLRRFVLLPICDLTDAVDLHPALSRPWRDLLRETAGQRCDVTDLTL